MIRINVEIEDVVISATYYDDNTKADYTPLWHGFVSDLHDLKVEPIHWTKEQMAAILALGLCEVGEDATVGYLVDHLYKVAEDALKDHKIRPIP